jgi:hypothetical protein
MVRKERRESNGELLLYSSKREQLTFPAPYQVLILLLQLFKDVPLRAPQWLSSRSWQKIFRYALLLFRTFRLRTLIPYRSRLLLGSSLFLFSLSRLLSFAASRLSDAFKETGFLC